MIERITRIHDDRSSNLGKITPATMKIDRQKLIRWECLARYFSQEKGKKLDVIFNNPSCDNGNRITVLNRLELTLEQKEFLLEVFDIDYIYIQDKKPILIEEKIKNIESEKFHAGNYIYFDHGTSTQYKHLREAYECGIEAGILLRCIKFKKMPEGLLGYAITKNENIEFEDSKFYPIQNCLHLKYQTKIPVDDFIKNMRELARNSRD